MTHLLITLSEEIARILCHALPSQIPNQIWLANPAQIVHGADDQLYALRFRAYLFKNLGMLLLRYRQIKIPMELLLH